MLKLAGSPTQTCCQTNFSCGSHCGSAGVEHSRAPDAGCCSSPAPVPEIVTTNVATMTARTYRITKLCSGSDGFCRIGLFLHRTPFPIDDIEAPSNELDGSNYRVFGGDLRRTRRHRLPSHFLEAAKRRWLRPRLLVDRRAAAVSAQYRWGCCRNRTHRPWHLETRRAIKSRSTGRGRFVALTGGAGHPMSMSAIEDRPAVLSFWQVFSGWTRANSPVQ